MFWASFQMNCMLSSISILICNILSSMLIFLWSHFKVLSYTLAVCCVCMCAELYLSFWDPMDYSLPSSSLHGISQTRILEWGAISFSRGSSQPRDWMRVSCASCIGRWILYHWATWEAPWFLKFVIFWRIQLSLPYPPTQLPPLFVARKRKNSW